MYYEVIAKQAHLGSGTDLELWRKMVDADDAMDALEKLKVKRGRKQILEVRPMVIVVHDKRKGKNKKKAVRTKGLDWVREVKIILRSLGEEVEGPKYKIMWIQDKITRETKPIQVHEDYFGVWDLISWSLMSGYRFHQVTSLPHKTDREKVILAKGCDGWLWGRTDIGNRVVYRRFIIQKGKIGEDYADFVLSECERRLKEEEARNEARARLQQDEF